MRRAGQADVVVPAATMEDDTRDLPIIARDVPARRGVQRWVAALALLAAVLAAVDVPGPWRAAVVAAALLLAPGLAVLPPSTRADGYARAAMAVALSLVVESLLALVAVWVPRLLAKADIWVSLWYPVPVGVVVLVLSALLLLWPDGSAVARLVRARRDGQAGPVRLLGARVRADLAARRRWLTRFARRSTFLAFAGWVAAAAVWYLGLRATDVGDIGEWGLIFALSPLVYVGLAFVVAVLIVGVVRRRPLAGSVMAAYTGLLVLILYGTAGFVETTPRLPWVYKHIAVVRYLEEHGVVNVDIDLYHRWPAFFAWAAQFAQLIGQPDPVTWANLVEPVSAVVWALFVLSLARLFVRDPRYYWTATLLFCLGDWINQNYLAPQAFAYVLYLFIVYVLLSTMIGRPRRWVEVLQKLLARLCGAAGRTTTENIVIADPVLNRAWAVVAVLVAYFVVTAAHQLTPYLILAIVGPLFVLGYLRPLWLLPALLAIAVGYLVPNFDYIQAHWGLSSGLDPLANATFSGLDRSKLPIGTLWSGRAAYLVTAVLYLLGAVGLVRRVRAGGVRSAVMIALMMSTPILVLGVQSYGGEGRLRVFLFSLPWCAIAAAWSFWPRSGGATPSLVARLVTVPIIAVLAPLFTFAYFAGEQEAHVPEADVAAAEWLDGQARWGDAGIATAPMFPMLIGPHYDNLIGNTDLPTYSVFFPQLMTRGDLQGIAAKLSDTPGKRTYIVFSEFQSAYDERHGALRPGELEGLEAQLKANPADKLVYDENGVRIYRMGESG